MTEIQNAWSGNSEKWRKEIKKFTNINNLTSFSIMIEQKKKMSEDMEDKQHYQTTLPKWHL